jgi:hypothetical protein
MYDRKNEEKKERKKERKRYMRKREKYEYVGKYSELPGSLKCIRKFKASRLKDPYSILQPCAI